MIYAELKMMNSVAKLQEAQKKQVEKFRRKMFKEQAQEKAKLAEEEADRLRDEANELEQQIQQAVNSKSNKRPTTRSLRPTTRSKGRAGKKTVEQLELEKELSAKRKGEEAAKRKAEEALAEAEKNVSKGIGKSKRKKAKRAEDDSLPPVPPVPPIRRPKTGRDIVYEAPNKTWVAHSLRKICLLNTLKAYIKEASLVGTLQLDMSGLQAIQADKSRKNWVLQLFNNIVEEKKKGKDLTSNVRDLLKVMPKPGEVDNTAITIHGHFQKIALGMQLVNVHEFKDKNGRFHRKRVTARHIGNSFSTWLPKSEVSALSNLFNYLGTIIESGQTDKLLKIVKKRYVKADKLELEQMLDDIIGYY